MPEDIAVGPDLERVLEHLDDFALNEANYKTIQDALEKSNKNINVTVLERVLDICVRDLKEDMKNPFQALNVLSALLNKVKTGSIHEIPNLVPSANAILHIIKTTALFNKVEDLKVLCFEIILSYPDNVLITLAVDHYIEIIEMLNLYCHQRIPMPIRLQAINIINKLLKILPPDKKATFVTEGIEIWFSKVVPTVMAFALSTTSIKNTMPIDTLETLTEELIAVDYSDNPTWLVVLECIYTPQKYPKIMQNLLEAGNEMWYRLWIIFTKLLKSQITKNMSSFGSPINSMLPVVEAAFKMNVKNRCRAFQCWNALIDNFAVESNEPYVNKRLKLLIIPLASNNAKVEETALAKLNTWLHLIRCFESKIINLPYIALLPFLYFCFGKPSVGDKPVSAPGLLTVNTKRQVLQAFSIIIGHNNCDCIVNMPKLNKKILTSDLLVEHWKIWTNSLTVTIRICVNDNSDSVTQHFKCIWKSFIAAISELPDSTTRYNLFFELLKMLQVLLQCHRCDRLSDLVFHILTSSILDHNDVVQPVFQLGNGQNNAMQSLISILLSPSLDYVFSRYDIKEIVIKLKPLAKFIVQKYLKQVTVQCLKVPLDKNNSLLLWTALAEAICELKCATSVDILHQMLLLPLKFDVISVFTSVDISIEAWFKLYYFASTLVDECCIDNDICEVIDNRDITGTSNKYFVFKVSLTILNYRTQKNNENDNLICKCAETLQYATDDIIYSSVENNLPLLQNTIISMVNKVTKENDKQLAKTTVSIVNNILKMVTKYFKQIEKDLDLANFIIKLLEPLELLFEQECYSTLKLIIIDELKKCSKCFSAKEKRVHTIVNKIIAQKNGTATLNSKDIADEKDKSPDNQDNFTEPEVKTIPKKGKKRDSNVMDTVVENGEEYVVVNSNWKFNPKKLTDNQKEKLKRTREDIPALYQDLSQSQDEFKTVYRTNSVDSTSASKSNTVENNVESSILKNMPCSNVVPTIIENILTESSKKDKQESTISDTTESNSNIKQGQNIKNSKTPRIAIKDRVFRNVKNLIEKSSLQKDDLNSTVNENHLLTPTRKKPVDNNLVNSAPPKINAERPIRMKRKPKKLEDHKLSPLKKRRSSLNQNNSQSVVPEQKEQQNKKYFENVEKSLDGVSKLIDIPIDNGTQNEDDVDKNSERNISKEVTNIEAVQENNKSTDINDATEQISKTIDSEADTTKRLRSDSPSTIESTTTDTVMTDPCDANVDKNNATPDTLRKEDGTPKSTKKGGRRVSRIEKVLAIDMVEGHPFLSKQSATRLTRKTIESNASIITRKSIEKMNKLKSSKTSTKNDTKSKEKIKSTSSSSSDSIEDLGTSQSQDIIESSQDSTISTISIKSGKNINKIPIVALENIKEIPKLRKAQEPKHDVEQSVFLDTQNNVEVVQNTLAAENNEDIELSRNKTVLQEITNDITAEMDTEVAEYITSSDEVTEIKNDNPILIINSEETCSGNDSQETANADTQPQDPDLLLDDINLSNLPLQSTVSDDSCNNQNETKTQNENSIPSQNKDDDTYCSPFKDEVQRKQDFMDSTLEISPIKTLSPIREEQKSLTPETSNDFVVIKLSSPVQSNGEPYNNSNSPEIFTNDKISPDKRDQSPPRNGPILNNSSPSSSLSLKKNRPQVRSGRAAQMLELCVPEGMSNFGDKFSEPEEKRSPATNMSARRNLRIMYNSASDNSEPSDETEDSSSFLKLKRPVPTAESSPSGPILKRKLHDIIDDTTVSPASKRKRVSFHDPPVSTTICVKKYIEPCGIRSPQNSMTKRLERQARVPTNAKSPKRLDTVFNNVLRLENVLTKTVESFAENDRTSSNDSEINSLEETTIDMANATDLNDTEPICPMLINCKDPIDNIVDELSPITMKSALIKDLEGKVTTISDLAKLSELEINRLSIKSPKVHVAKRVLTEYANKINISNDGFPKIKEYKEEQNTIVILDDEKDELNNKIDIEVQTELNSSLASTQTDAAETFSSETQTVQSGEMTTSYLIASLSKKPDFISQLCEHLDESSKQEIAKKLPVNSLTETLIKKVDIPNSYDTVITLLDHHRNISPNGTLSEIQDYLCTRFSTKDLIQLCSEILKNVSDKTN